MTGDLQLAEKSYSSVEKYISEVVRQNCSSPLMTASPVISVAAGGICNLDKSSVDWVEHALYRLGDVRYKLG
jgi:hypothetical protein